ncbi:MAG: hypothetical protein FWG66_00715 [Spirochaetes bacterium]|nr:hypothetical protein [Spirochaetota bacterium]
MQSKTDTFRQAVEEFSACMEELENRRQKCLRELGSLQQELESDPALAPAKKAILAKNRIDSWIKTESKNAAEKIKQLMFNDLSIYIMQASNKISAARVEIITEAIWNAELSKYKDEWARHFAKEYGFTEKPFSTPALPLDAPEPDKLSGGFANASFALMESVKAAGLHTVLVGGLGVVALRLGSIVRDFAFTIGLSALSGDPDLYDPPALPAAPDLYDAPARTGLLGLPGRLSDFLPGRPRLPNLPNLHDILPDLPAWTFSLDWLGAILGNVGRILILVALIPIIPTVIDKFKERNNRRRQEQELRLKDWMLNLDLTPFIAKFLNAENEKLYKEHSGE